MYCFTDEAGENQIFAKSNSGNCFLLSLTGKKWRCILKVVIFAKSDILLLTYKVCLLGWCNEPFCHFKV